MQVQPEFQPVDPEQPLVSALMLAGKQPAWQVQLAVDCFAAQTYPNRELIIVNSAPNQYQASQLQLRLPERALLWDISGPQPAGACRSYAASAANGQILVQFDAHCWHAPQRIQLQLEALQKHQAQFCFLQQGLELGLETGYLGLWRTSKNCLMQSMMWVRTPDCDYQALDKCEELSLAAQLKQKQARPIALNRPGLICRMNYGMEPGHRPLQALTGVEPRWVKQMARVLRRQSSR